MTEQLLQQPWLTIFTSWIGSGALSAVVAGVLNLRAKQNEYVNDYYKNVIRRRITAYEKLERLLVNLKAAVIAPDDPRPYHILFASEKDEDWKRAFLMVCKVLSEGLWLTEETFNKTRDLSCILFQHEKPASVIEYGRKHYQELATRRDELERLLARDMLSLHDVKRFLKGKDRPDPGFHPIRLG